MLESSADIFPIPDVPAPPRPSGHGSRTRHRYKWAYELWQVAQRVRDTLNQAVGAHVPVQALPPMRLRFLRLPPAHREVVEHIFREGARLRDARRASFIEVPTGADLKVGIVNAIADTYSLAVASSRYVA